jgi:membrane protease YdiL (CAAX protease family)
MEPSARAAGREALIAWAVCAALVSALVQLRIELPAIGDLGSALIAVLFLYMPVAVAWRRKEDLEDYGFRREPVRRGIATAATALAVIVPVFTAGYIAFCEIACASPTLAPLVAGDVCPRYAGLGGVHWPAWTWSDLEFAAVQLVVVALPEELFFRGMLLRLLEQRFPPRWRPLGGGVGVALVLSSLGFALIHVPKYGPSALAVFFPGLLFGWMRSATGSILASTLTHAGCNILIRALQLAVKR